MNIYISYIYTYIYVYTYIHIYIYMYYFLARGGTQNNKDCIIQLPAGYTFIRDNILKKTGRLAWRCIDSKKKNGPGCNCRVTTPVDYDDLNEPD